jgi:hypothetical protein
MFIICIPNITHDYINIISDEYNINISKSKAIFIDNYYLYKVDRNLTSGVLYQIKSNNTNNVLYTINRSVDNYNYILMYPTMYDTGIAKIYHNSQNDIIMMIDDKVIEVSL